MRSKDIQMAISSQKNGIEELQRKFGFSTTDDLFSAIKADFPGSYNYFTRKLKQQAKKHPSTYSYTIADAKKHQSIKEASNNTDAEICQSELSKPEEVSSVPEQCTSTENIISVDDNSTSTSEQENNIMEKTLEELKSIELKISESVCKLESEHKEMVSKRRVLLKKIEQSKSALEEIQRLLAVNEQKVTEIYDEYLACGKSMEENNTQRKTLMEKLTETRNQISNLQKISILVYENATIEIENSECIEDISEEVILADLYEFFKLPETGNFTINELRCISKLKKIVEDFKKAGKNIDIAFDNPSLEAFWKNLSA